MPSVTDTDTPFLDAALVLIGHGSTVNDQSAAAVYQQAGELRRQQLFSEVREAFWKQEPKLAEVAAGLTSQRVFFVPLLISEGYFSEGVLPQALGFATADEKQFSRVLNRGEQRWFYGQPVGTHPRMTELLLARAREVVSTFPFPRAPKPSEITLFIAGHGTTQNENSRKAIERQVLQIRAMNIYAAVEAVFLEEEPKISACYELARTRNIVVVPFFIGDGMHVQEDIPLLLGEPERILKKRLSEKKSSWRNPTERKGKLVWYAGSVGSDPALAEVILERVREAVKWK
jgi:sirohydrochlorin cobaltochelatase